MSDPMLYLIVLACLVTAWAVVLGAHKGRTKAACECRRQMREGSRKAEAEESQ